MSQPKVWFITGSTRGIGAEIVTAALAAGDHVVATGRNRDQIAATFKEHSERLLPVELDVSEEPGFTRTDFLESSSLRYGTRQIAGYEETSAKLRSHYASYNGQQSGDPAKLAAVLLTLANSDNPPMRFASGSDAFEGMTSKLAGVQRELHDYQKLSASIDGAGA